MIQATETEPKRLTAQEIANRRLVTVNTVRVWWRKGVGGVVLNSHRVGGRRYSYEADLRAFDAALNREDEVSKPKSHKRVSNARQILKEEYGVG